METSELLALLLGGSAVATFGATLLKVWTDKSKFVQEIARLDARINHLEAELKESREQTDGWRRIYNLLLDKHLRLRALYQQKTGETLPELELPEIEQRRGDQ
jgi:hypothetical protein